MFKITVPMREGPCMYVLQSRKPPKPDASTSLNTLHAQYYTTVTTFPSVRMHSQQPMVISATLGAIIIIVLMRVQIKAVDI